MVTVVGIGPGHPDYVTPAALRCIAEADVVIGGKRPLASVDTSGKQVHFITGDVDAAMAAIHENRDRKVAVVVSGDPGFYSILRTVRERLPHVEVAAIPGISSIQMLFAAIGQDWSDVAFASVHGRGIEGLAEAVRRNGKACVLTDEKLTAPVVAGHLLEAGLSGRAVAGAHLSYPEQRIVDTSIEALAGMEGLGSSVLYIEIGG